MILKEKVFYERFVDDVKITVTDRYIKVGSATYDIRHVQAVKRVEGTWADFLFGGTNSYVGLVVISLMVVWLVDFLCAVADAFDLADIGFGGGVSFILSIPLLLIFGLMQEVYDTDKRKPYRIVLVYADKKQRLHKGYLFELDDYFAVQNTLGTAILRAKGFATPVHEVLGQIKANMVAVEGGEFLMGASPDDPEALDSERPQHCVKVEGFQISRYLVTQAQWAAVMGSNPSEFSGCDDCPVEKVSWDDTQEFIRKLNLQTGKSYRLPTEAEWEFAARGGNKSKGYTYAGSNVLDEVGWYDDNSDDKTHPVGQKQANELGLYDMSGNVWEWCSPYAYPLRGGGWNNDAKRCRVSSRKSSNPDTRSSRIGFRYRSTVDLAGFRLVLP